MQAEGAPQMLEVGGLVGEYRIEGLVGQGGMGQVYGAIHPLIGKRAAIKVLRRELCSDPESIERFVLEARAVNQIGHPNIVDIFAFGALPDGRQYMVMEWLRGESLAERLARQPPSLDETCEILLGVCAALDAAHAEHIIHRDLKPHNVFLCDARAMRPTVKLLDFGLVKLMGSDDVRMERTRSGSLLGTPAYMSPEQARGRGVDHRTDIYALGVMAFELATGALPFMEPSAMEIIVAHMQQTPPAPSAVRPGLPAALDELVLGMLAKDPADRPTLAHVMSTLGTLRSTQLAAPPRPQVLAHAETIASAPPRAASRALTSVPAGQLHVETAQIRPRRARVLVLGVLGAVAAGVVAFVVAGRSLAPADDESRAGAATPAAPPMVGDPRSDVERARADLPGDALPSGAHLPVDARRDDVGIALRGDAGIPLQGDMGIGLHGDAGIDRAGDAAVEPSTTKRRGKPRVDAPRDTSRVDAPRDTSRVDLPRAVPPDAPPPPKPDATPPRHDDGDGLLKTGGSR